ncbi:hypothetical protein UC8_38380 [Roseimaritima ulvae]|uniref:MraY-like glycosyltransferase n=2 Tax=Roseimaritima ulvae TaxID=980254 RepID=A0A5B9R5L1_9BACT|nr:hypothetical protein UC8_38380 [Roseimaritima ulvae]
MVVTHECGHLIGGLLGGATLTEVDLAPWRLPYSLHSPDPLPLVTLWAGPIVGVLIPVLVAAICRRLWVWFIADFCMLANGVYLALAWISGDRFLDTPRLLAAGAPPVTIVIYCVLTMGLGYWWFRSDCARCLWSVPADPKRGNGGDCVPRGDVR